MSSRKGIGVYTPTLGDEAQVDARFGPFGDSANLDARLVHGFALNIPQAQKSFWTHQIEHLDD
jgi:hypothetical protein